MTQVGRHFLDPNTEIKTGTLGKNKLGLEGWGDPIPGIHAYNPVTGNDIFFSDQGQGIKGVMIRCFTQLCT